MFVAALLYFCASRIGFALALLEALRRGLLWHSLRRLLPLLALCFCFELWYLASCKCWICCQISILHGTPCSPYALALHWHVSALVTCAFVCCLCTDMVYIVDATMENYNTNTHNTTALLHTDIVKWNGPDISHSWGLLPASTRVLVCGPSLSENQTFRM